MNSRFKFVVVSGSTLLVVLLLLGSTVGRTASPDEAYRHLSVYTEVLSRIKSEYVEEPDIKNVTLGAMNGMLEAIDPFASYLTSEQYKSYLKSLDAKKADVGLRLSKRFGYVGVVNVVPGSSAWRAGLATGDMLEAINGVATRDMPLAYAEMLLQGDPGSNIEVSVLRVRKPEPQKVTLTRAVSRYPNVSSRMLPNGIGLVQVPALDSRTKEFVQHVETLQKQGAKKLILDLRNNGFGKPEEGVALANLFVDNGTLTYLEGQKVRRQDFAADPAKASFRDLPLAVLINRGTAGGAEIAAAALLDTKRAELIGEPTYGDAALRRAVTLDDGSAVLLAVAKYYSPSGKAIQDAHVTPGVTVVEELPVTNEDEEVAVAPPTPKTDDEDLPLKRAIEVLNTGKPQSAATAPTPSRDINKNAPDEKPLTIEKVK